MNNIESCTNTQSSYQVCHAVITEMLKNTCQALSLAHQANTVSRKTFKLLCARRWKSQHIEGWASGGVCQHLIPLRNKTQLVQSKFYFHIFSSLILYLKGF